MSNSWTIEVLSLQIDPSQCEESKLATLKQEPLWRILHKGGGDDIPFGMDDEAETETAIVATTQEQFDYGQLDNETAEYLKGAANRITDIVIKSATELGKEFKEAQERLAQHHNGTFGKWYISLGFSEKTVYRLINRYNLVLSNWRNSELIESLPLSLSYEISKPSAPKQLVDATLLLL